MTDDLRFKEISQLFDEVNAAYAALVRYQYDHWIGWALGFRAGRLLQKAHHRACVAHHAACVAHDREIQP